MEDSDDAQGSGRGEEGEGDDESSVLSEEAKELVAVAPKMDAEEWGRRLEACEVPRSIMNKLVMSYVIMEGHQRAAVTFQRESGTEPSVDLRTIEERVAIRRAVLSGNLALAMELVNKMDPSLLERDSSLLFRLRRQHLLELIRGGRVEEALDYARDELSALGSAEPFFMEQLEQVMTLLAFKDAAASPLAHLLNLEQRQTTATQLNAAILASQYQEKEPRMQDLLRQLVRSQRQMRSKVMFPVISGVAKGSRGSV